MKDLGVFGTSILDTSLFQKYKVHIMQVYRPNLKRTDRCINETVKMERYRVDKLPSDMRKLCLEEEKEAEKCLLDRLLANEAYLVRDKGHIYLLRISIVVRDSLQFWRNSFQL